MNDRMLNVNNHRKIYQVLRITVAMCFIGHGAFGIITKAIWCNYFGVFGIGPELSYKLMPLVGSIDILFGVIMLVYPNRSIPAWLVIWGLITAFLRPLSGEHFAEFIERAGNYGTPLALLILVGIPKKIKDLPARIQINRQPSEQTMKHLDTCLRVAGFLLLAGHGWLNLVMKKGLLLQYSHLGISDVAVMAKTIGIAEIIAAFIVLIKPYRELLFIFFIWKMLSEAFYPNYPLFEWIERGGSYGTLLALWFLTNKSLFPEINKSGFSTMQMDYKIN